MEQGKTGPFIGIIIIVIVLLMGGYYIMKNRPEPEPTITAEEIVGLPDTVLETLEAPPSASTEIDDIASDLEATPLEDLDIDLGDLDSELNFDDLDTI